jgi:hypothetical protein
VSARHFGGADFSGARDDPRRGTWWALLELRGGVLRLKNVEPSGRAGLRSLLLDEAGPMGDAEAFGIDAPLSLPGAVAALVCGAVRPPSWAALVDRVASFDLAAFRAALAAARAKAGEARRMTDERCGAFSPLHAVNPDMRPMTFHAIRLAAELRPQWRVRPFDPPGARQLLEVYPGAAMRREIVPRGAGRERLASALRGLERLDRHPVVLGATLRGVCLGSRDAFDAVLAARAAAAAVLDGQASLAAAALAPGEGPRVAREGWIYGCSPSG